MAQVRSAAAHGWRLRHILRRGERQSTSSETRRFAARRIRTAPSPSVPNDLDQPASRDALISRYNRAAGGARRSHDETVEWVGYASQEREVLRLCKVERQQLQLRVARHAGLDLGDANHAA